MNKIVLYLMNNKGMQVLRKVVEEYTSGIIEYVVLSKDSAVENDYYNELLHFCKTNSISFYNRNDNIDKFGGYKFAIGWRWIISDYDKLIILHDSILPKYRGFSPLVNMLINGEKEIGVTALFANQEYDTGPIILQRKRSINYPIKIAQAIELISELYQVIITEIIKKIIRNDMIVGVPQIESIATYSIWRDEEDYLIDWSKDATYIKRSIDALGFPFKGSRTKVNNEYIIIEDSEVIDDVEIENRIPGKVIFFKNGYPVVICGNGLLKITKINSLTSKFSISKMKFRTRFEGK